MDIDNLEILLGDCRQSLKSIDDESINTCITSPPYWSLRNYENKDQIGLEDTPEQFIDEIVSVFREVKRVLRDDGTLWLNLGDVYVGGGRGGDPKWKHNGKQTSGEWTMFTKPQNTNLKAKNLVGLPWRVALALQQDGWYLRQDIIWHKPNPMPEPVKDRCTKSHEYLFLLSKNKKYYFDSEAIKEPAIYTGKKNKRSVWSVTTKSYKGAHFAVFPPELIEPCVLAGCPEGGTVLDPFGGSGTTAAVALKYNRKAIICELNENYVSLIPNRISGLLDKKQENNTVWL